MSTKKINLEQFSTRLGILAQRLGLSRPDIAQAIGVKRQTVDHWFQGRNYPKPAAMKKLAETLKVTVDSLLDPQKQLMDIRPSPWEAVQQLATLAPDQPSEGPKSPRESTTRQLDASRTVGRERRASWHSDPRKNELLRMAAFILQSNHPTITAEFEDQILEAHKALVSEQPAGPEPEREKNEYTT